MTDQEQQQTTIIEEPPAPTHYRRRRRKRSTEGSLTARTRISNPRAFMAVTGLILLVGLFGFCVYWINSQRLELQRVNHDTKRYQQVATDLELKAAQIKISEVNVVDLHSGEAGDPLDAVRVPAIDGTLTFRLHLPPTLTGLRELLFLDAESKERARGRAKASAEGIMFVNVQGLTKGRYEIVCRSLQVQQRGKFREPMYRFAVILN
jgi:hypothetical protein